MIEEISPTTSQTSTDSTDAQTYRFSYDRKTSQSLSVSIIRAVATVAGVDPLSLQPRLYDVVDPDALETLVTSNTAHSNVQVTFEFGAYRITVTQNGEIIVQDDPETPPADKQ